MTRSLIKKKRPLVTMIPLLIWYRMATEQHSVNFFSEKAVHSGFTNVLGHDLFEIFFWLVLEDDAVFHEHFPSLWQEYRRQLEPDWGVVFTDAATSCHWWQVFVFFPFFLPRAMVAEVPGPNTYRPSE